MIPILVAVLTFGEALAGDRDPVTQGRSQYTAKCLACHGATGKGDGPAARALATPTPDLTTAAFWNGLTDEKLKTLVSAWSPASEVHSYTLESKELDDIVLYLRTFEPEANP